MVVVEPAAELKERGQGAEEKDSLMTRADIELLCKFKWNHLIAIQHAAREEEEEIGRQEEKIRGREKLSVRTPGSIFMFHGKFK